MGNGKLISELTRSERKELLDRMREADRLLCFAVKKVRSWLRIHEQGCVDCEDCHDLRHMLFQSEALL